MLLNSRQVLALHPPSMEGLDAAAMPITPWGQCCAAWQEPRGTHKRDLELKHLSPLFMRSVILLLCKSHFSLSLSAVVELLACSHVLHVYVHV